MPAFSRAAEITYYEEFGLAPDASPEDIRDAFRSLVRLLHPDQQTDEQLKDIAEKQMRKLNRIYAVLSDSERRQRYDESLDDNYRPVIVRAGPSLAASHLAGRLAWAGAIVVSAALLIWLASYTPPATQVRAHDAPRGTGTASRYQSPDTPDTPQDIARLKSDLRAVVAERDAALREVSRLRGSPLAPQAGSAAADESQIQTPTTATLIGELPLLKLGSAPSPSAPAIAPNAARTEPPPAQHLAGFWFYARPPHGQHNKNLDLYVPEFMEATIEEENGGLSGTYRSRYQIVDRAISPDVNFTFSCASAGLVVTCPWTGPGGAKGDLTMRLNGENSLHLDWNASQLGTLQGLVSGTAVLTRRIEPIN